MNTVTNTVGFNFKGMRLFAAGAAVALSLAATDLAAQPGGRGPGGPDSHGPGRGGPEMGMFNPRMLRELKLAPDQEKKLNEARLASQKLKIQLRSEKAVLELDLKNLLDTYPVNKAEILKTGEKIADVERKITMQRIEGMTQLLSSLTPEQHRKFKDLQVEWMEKRRAWKEEMRGEGEGAPKGGATGGKPQHH